MSAGSSKACDRTDLKYDLTVKFDAGDYVSTILDEILAGKLKPGDTRTFHVGVDPQPGAEICKPTRRPEGGDGGGVLRHRRRQVQRPVPAIKKKVYGF